MSGYFTNLGDQVKIGIIVAVGVVVALAIGLLGLHALNGAAGAAHRIYANNLSSTNALGLVSTAMAQARLSLANQILSGDVATTAKYTKAFESDLKSVESALADYRNSRPAAEAEVVA